MNVMKKHIAFIMAGGIGERFWPITSEAFPKYAMTFADNQSFLKATYDRLKMVFPEENIGVITSIKHRALVLKLLPSVNKNLLLCEAVRRNTAAAVTWGSLVAQQLFGESAVVSFYPADALILKKNLFVKAVRQASQHATSQITLIGIKPSRPSTGYGYIKIKKTTAHFSPVLKFKEKPNTKTAQQYLASGDYLWNSGIFFWTVRQFFFEMQRHNPDYLLKFKPIMKAKACSFKSVSTVFLSLPSEPIDKLLIEKLNALVCIKAKFKWDDIGSWEALHRMSVSKHVGNLLLAKGDISKTSGTIVYSDTMKFAIHGVKDLIVVEKDGIVLICSRHEAESVKQIRQNWLQKKR